MADLIAILERPGLRVLALDLDEHYRRQGIRLSELLNPHEQQRAHRLSDHQQRRRFIASRSALRCLLADTLDLPPHRVHIRLSAGGRPFLAREREIRLSFNLSHSGPKALIALSRRGPVGVDLESIRPLPRATALARRLYPLRLFQQWRKTGCRKEFLRTWTQAEASIKAFGLGLTQLEELEWDQQGRIIGLRGQRLRPQQLDLSGLGDTPGYLGHISHHPWNAGGGQHAHPESPKAT